MVELALLIPACLLVLVFIGAFIKGCSTRLLLALGILIVAIVWEAMVVVVGTNSYCNTVFETPRRQATRQQVIEGQFFMAQTITTVGYGIGLPGLDALSCPPDREEYRTKIAYDKAVQHRQDKLAKIHQHAILCMCLGPLLWLFWFSTAITIALSSLPGKTSAKTTMGSSTSEGGA